VWPDFYGNRSPLADPSLLGMVISLSFSFYIQFKHIQIVILTP
jgi:ribulose kinase